MPMFEQLKNKILVNLIMLGRSALALPTWSFIFLQFKGVLHLFFKKSLGNMNDKMMPKNTKSASFLL